jgi:SAM-dependent methyltransferase
MATTPTAYDAVPYPSTPYSQTHPDRLATLATLYGLTPASPEKCRVLELGCGDGGNLVPMAYALPESEFLGIDLAESAVENGRRTIAALGLRNISLLAADLSSVSGLGTFDYVIAHGLYSWVPPAVQQRILRLSRDVLAPHGVAYVSYNAYPGNYSRDVVRRMMRYHVRAIHDPARGIEEARAIVRLLSETALPDPVFSAILAEALRFHEKAQDSVIFHDELAEVNESLLFVDFVERAGAHGLQFLSEADYPDMVAWNEETPAGRLLERLGRENILLQQQYRDFLVFRKFRQTLLCRDDAILDRPERPARLRKLCIAAPIRPERPDPDIATDALLRFLGLHDAEVTTPHPLTKSAFLVLGEAWPSWLPWESLLALASQRLAASGGSPVRPEDEDRLLNFLLRTSAASVSELHVMRPPFVTELSDRPRVSALARRQASETTVVTSLSHKSISLEDRLVRRLVLLLDGTRDRVQIEEAMARFVRETNGPGTDALLAALPEGIARNLDHVAGLALLEA